jgi:succinyl-diaminopimelate desuccinylase
MTDLVQLTAALVDIPSVSHNEMAITDDLAGRLAAAPWLDVTRVGENLVARTHLGRSQRLLIGGHTDTVPANGNERARIEGDVLWGLGSCDMKSGLAVMLELALTVPEPGIDVTYVFYECEEIDSQYNGVERLFRERPDLVAAGAAILAEPTGAMVEAGCQGTMRAVVTQRGVRAHSARPWLGVNAIHRLGPVLTAVAGFQGRQVDIDGCLYLEALSAVGVEGGVAGNVVPDRATVVLNHRFAPDRTPDQAEASLRQIVGAVDEFEVVDFAVAAAPGLGHPLLKSLVAASGGPPRAKLGWTDVARFASRGIPATNFGPGDPNVAHAADERVTRAELEKVYSVLRTLLG